MAKTNENSFMLKLMFLLLIGTGVFMLFSQPMLTGFATDFRDVYPESANGIWTVTEVVDGQCNSNNPLTANYNLSIKAEGDNLVLSFPRSRMGRESDSIREATTVRWPLSLDKILPTKGYFADLKPGEISIESGLLTISEDCNEFNGRLDFYYQGGGDSCTAFADIRGYKTEQTGCIVCEVNWTVGEWSECLDGEQTRTVVDVNNCKAGENKPEEKRGCVVLEKQVEVTPAPVAESNYLLMGGIIAIVAVIAAAVYFYLRSKKGGKLKRK